LEDDSIESVCYILNEELAKTLGPFAPKIRPLSEVVAC
jgi:hypothetical protein